jgi:3-oxoacyl-[acyl-carrier-protein] synthase-3
MSAAIREIEYWLPEKVVTNADLAREYREWDVKKIADKTGILQRHIAANNECASDLGFEAAKKIFSSGRFSPSDIDYLILCTQSPDYFLPTSACLLQERLGIPVSTGALDINLGCSGYIYGLGLAKGLIDSAQARNVLLITADTYSKFLNPGDRSVRTLFGDAGAATIISASENGVGIGDFVYGTDGKGAGNLIVAAGGMRQRHDADSSEACDGACDQTRSPRELYMNGSEIFMFALQKVPRCIQALLHKSGKSLEDIDLFVFHQANRHMLGHLQRRMGIADEKFVYALANCGNTVSSSIPIALKDAESNGQLRPGATVMLVGFGVGYSWGATLVEW